MEQYGYLDRILHVDLGDQRTWIERPGEAFYRRYGGGRGIIAHYLLTEVPAGADPLGPDNVLVFATGVATGAPVPGAGRHSVGAKSPLTGAFGESEAGGFWGAELKRAGWDAIVFHGASPTPVYLSIVGDRIEFHAATHLWGMITGDAEERIVAELGDPFTRVALIGPAGENLVRYACIANDLNEVAGRTGMGAVMGSKRLKAIAVRGRTPVRVADPDALLAVAKWVSETMDQNHRAYHEYGTGAAMQGKNLEGGVPTLNYRLGQFEDVHLIDAVALREQLRAQMTGCFACSVRCRKVVRIEKREEDARENARRTPAAVDPKGRYSVDPKYGGPEYETLAAFGSNLGVEDLVAICKSNEMCNYLGMDTISTGATIAWAMECYEHGILTDAETDGMPLRFRDADGVVRLIEMIARRQGIGDLLAEGSQRAAARIGRGAERYLTTVKGMEMAMHDPRHMPGMRVSYLLAPTGGDHNSQTGNRGGLRNQVGLCHFLNFEDEQSLHILRAVTGWDLTPEELVETAHRGLTLARLFNVREGFGREDDDLPLRFHEDLPMHKGLTDEEIAAVVEAYYVEQGWDPETGVPTEDTVDALGIRKDAAGMHLPRKVASESGRSGIQRAATALD
jgi:aldehyde:ferredoxin oxidoreductase